MTRPPQRTTRQRTAVGELLQRTSEFRTAAQIHDDLRHAGEDVGLTTVYRTLQLMVEAEQLDAIRTDDGEIAYRRCSTGHHHHLVCRGCGHTVDVDCARGPAPCLDPVDPQGFDIDEAEVVYWGRCPACATDQQIQPSRTGHRAGPTT